MNSSKFRLTLDLHSVQSQYAIPVMVGDTNVILLMSITDGGVPFIIEDGCLAKISIKRPTGTHLEDFCAIRNNAVIEFPFSKNENTCAVEGIHECDLTIYGLDGEKVGSPRFTMIVSERVIRSDDIILSDRDYTAVDAMIAEEAKRQVGYAQIIEAEAKREATLQSILENEQSRIEAENIREGNEEARLQAGETAMNAVKRAEDSAGRAEDMAVRAEKAVDEVEELVITYIGDVDALIGGDT